ncbi:FAD-dependent monooxygenase [Blastopirellula sp. JC732]|uniref:FAD-dependent monooxygenase n=1 Tax=Blastopirellula sediminis TaxID=2894196 RepID=A0A9X1SJ62_9BACT|nr:FAD-dependent monooxygenase [Blastopirellula sediminis]MCC9604694.1 FAD-dependent monooxygenase [Blastopirellula sediminis]MCC9632007.1 FAD-dependent monooxygenase [Blastopirellula sediminis]
MDSPLLVVGAGPVGLAAALTLSRFNVPLRIIDRNDAPTTLSKALVLWRRSLINLDPAIPYETWLGQGMVPKGLHFFDQGAYHATMTLDNSGHVLPPGLLIPQSNVEASLIDALEKRGVIIERETCLESFERKGDRVLCQLKTPQGTECVETPYLFGCDGAHSTVRHGLGLDFAGESVAQRWLLGDIEVNVKDGVNPHTPRDARERALSHGWLYSTNSDQGSLQLFPITDTRYRIFVEAGMVGPETPRQDPTIADLQASLIERTRLQWKITDAYWLADFRINERQVSQYVHGNVFLAGDAAHVHSPAGGQGMNTGIQDAVNLAWKTALVMRGAADASLLETYQEERHPVAARVIKISGRAMRMTMNTNRLTRGVQDVIQSIVTHIPAVRKMVTSILAEDDVKYLNSSLSGESEGKIEPGVTMPDVPIEIDGQSVSSIQLLRPEHESVFYTLILMADAKPALWPTDPLLQCRQLGQDFRDPERHFQSTFGLHADSGVLVRPDGVIAAEGSPSAIRTWLARSS